VQFDAFDNQVSVRRVTYEDIPASRCTCVPGRRLHAEAMNDYRKASGERHALLRKMMPDWRMIQETLGRGIAAIIGAAGAISHQGASLPHARWLSIRVLSLFPRATNQGSEIRVLQSLIKWRNIVLQDFLIVRVNAHGFGFVCLK